MDSDDEMIQQMMLMMQPATKKFDGTWRSSHGFKKYLMKRGRIKDRAVEKQGREENI
jgi:hypothetical protein